ncbi:MAG: hypothetical protein MZV64_28845 [Ignavibacteriales bacterium]|nr:hypothetical protein [Ignavibacteriales bacterium]
MRYPARPSPAWPSTPTTTPGWPGRATCSSPTSTRTSSSTWPSTTRTTTTSMTGSCSPRASAWSFLPQVAINNEGKIMTTWAFLRRRLRFQAL